MIQRKYRKMKILFLTSLFMLFLLVPFAQANSELQGLPQGELGELLEDLSGERNYLRFSHRIFRLEK